MIMLGSFYIFVIFCLVLYSERDFSLLLGIRTSDVQTFVSISIAMCKSFGFSVSNDCDCGLLDVGLF